MITDTLEDIAGGAHALSELDFTRLIRRLTATVSCASPRSS
jgi:hypothetical protein